MNVLGISGRAPSFASSPAPSPRALASKPRTVDQAAIVATRQMYQSGLRQAEGGHAIQEMANKEEVPVSSLQRIRAVLSQGFASMRGGHRVQQLTHEPVVPPSELVQIVDSIARNVNGFAGGSAVQHEVRQPALADSFGPRARMLAQDIAAKLQSQPSAAAAVQSRGIRRARVGALV